MLIINYDYKGAGDRAAEPGDDAVSIGSRPSTASYDSASDSDETLTLDDESTATYGEKQKKYGARR